MAPKFRSATQHDDKVAATLPHGLAPYVVPELETITIGGAVSGCSLESMSFEVGGIKTLIAPNYYGEEDFWQVFLRGNHFKVKARTYPGGLFRDLYTKTCRAAQGLT